MKDGLPLELNFGSFGPYPVKPEVKFSNSSPSEMGTGNEKLKV